MHFLRNEDKNGDSGKIWQRLRIYKRLWYKLCRHKKIYYRFEIKYIKGKNIARLKYLRNKEKQKKHTKAQNL